MTTNTHSSDFLIIGSGLAGLYAALRLAEHGSVTVVTKRALGESNTRYAQGGIAAVLGDDDSVEAHVSDTLVAGDHLCNEEVVRSIVTDGPGKIRELIELGVAFDRDRAGDLALGREGAHTHRRVAHVEDRTGLAISEALVAATRADPNVRILENHMAVDLILDSRRRGEHGRAPADDRVVGAFVLDRDSHEISSFLAPVTLLAAGGAGKAYKFTSNPDIATGDGLAMAYRAGARLANLEFIQFHPTCLYHHVARSFLVSEACRGEGATLTTIDGRAFMSEYDPRAELASRDIVARAIDAELKRLGHPYVLLHLEHLPADRVRQRFPQIYERCAGLGIDITQQPMPVVPAAHYVCGGVMTGLDARTDVPGLLAAGEVTHTGMHGANRLASNSLLEAAVMSARAIESAVADHRRLGSVDPHAPWDSGHAVRVREAIILEHDWNNVRALMWDYVGIVRSDERLAIARERLKGLRRTIEGYFARYLLTPDLIELRNIALVAELVATSADRRRESRGLHYNVDHPERLSAFDGDTVVAKHEGTS